MGSGGHQIPPNEPLIQEFRRPRKTGVLQYFSCHLSDMKYDHVTSQFRSPQRLCQVSRTTVGPPPPTSP